MDGIFIAYHNTAQILGLQYMSVRDMDDLLFGEPGVGNSVFRACVRVLEVIYDGIAVTHPQQVLCCCLSALHRQSSMQLFGLDYFHSQQHY
jgi:hypothetical protein